MAGCRNCGGRCKGRYCCDECRLSDQEDPTINWGTCPDCDGISSSDGVRCNECRRGGDD